MYLFFILISYPGYVIALAVILVAFSFLIKGYSLPRVVIIFAALPILAQLAFLNWRSWQAYQTQKQFAVISQLELLKPTQPLGSRVNFTVEITGPDSQSRRGYKDYVEIVRYGPVQEERSANVWIRPKQELDLSECGKLYELEYDPDKPCKVSQLSDMTVGVRADLFGQVYVIETPKHWITIRNSSLSSVNEAANYARGLKPDVLRWNLKLF